MFEKKLNKNVTLIAVGYFLATAFICFLLYRQLSGEIVSGRFRMLDYMSGVGFWAEIICLGVFCALCLTATASILKQIISHRNTAFTIDNEGIHNTIAYATILFIPIVLPVRFIPWSATKELSHDGNFLTLYVDKSLVNASPIAKLVLKTLGYHFCRGLTLTELTEGETSVITAYCKAQPGCITDKSNAASDKAFSKLTIAGIIILLLLNAVFLIFTFFNYSSTAEISCTLTSLLVSLFGLEGNPAFAEYLKIADNTSFIYFELDNNFLHDVWYTFKIVHVGASAFFVYKLLEKRSDKNIRKMTATYLLCTVLIATAGFTTLQFAVHNRTEANETQVIHSEYGKEDAVILRYSEAEKVRVYILETENEKGYLAYECAVDVTANGKTYTFFGTGSTIYEDMENFIKLFDENIVEIDATYWDTDEFQDYTYSGYEEVLDRIYKK